MYTYRVTLTLIVVQFLFNSIGFSIDRVYSNSPLNIGPQYPFMMLRTMFEPDTGWISKAGEVMVEYSFRNMNTYVMSSNSTQSSSYGGDPSVFTGSGSGYSVYFDGELLWSNIHLKMGIEDDFEIQFTHRSVRFLSGALDDMVENFHNTFGLTNQGREHTEQDKFGIYVWDNAKQEMVYQLSHPGEELKDQSTTVGLKLPLTKKSDLNTALSLKYNIYQTEFDNPDSETDLSSGDFDQLSKSINLSLNSSASHQELTLHSAISLTLFDQPIVERGPNR
ncbi:MAG: DUF3187 family protein, partial [Proteobacteria bacterium]|nr:DUF3187 family protein [Pseudomonadota bacterium]